MRNALFAGLGLLVAGAAIAQQQMPSHTGHASPAMPQSMPMMPHEHVDASSSEAIAGYRAANEKMHRDMAVALTGDADRDFVASMIPHHQGAIDMAKVELAYGKDPEIRRLAEGIVAAQEAEIREMEEWLARSRPGGTPR
jgi:uncharacterized protein (DUF305 family)